MSRSSATGAHGLCAILTESHSRFLSLRMRRSCGVWCVLSSVGRRDAVCPHCSALRRTSPLLVSRPLLCGFRRTALTRGVSWRLQSMSLIAHSRSSPTCDNNTMVRKGRKWLYSGSQPSARRRRGNGSGCLSTTYGGCYWTWVADCLAQKSITLRRGKVLVLGFLVGLSNPAAAARIACPVQAVANAPASLPGVPSVSSSAGQAPSAVLGPLLPWATVS